MTKWTNVEGWQAGRLEGWKACRLASEVRGSGMTDPPPAACGQPAGRIGLQASAAYPGEGEHPFGEAGAFAVKGVRTELMPGGSEIGCNVLRP